MACPFFFPESVEAASGWARPPRMPLGDIFLGHCCAVPNELMEPPEARQRDLCNRGYARGECSSFPADAPGDAVRFSIIGDDGGRIRMVYVIERNHVPVKHGPLEFAEVLTGAEGVLAAQARAYVESYRRR